MFLRYVRSRRRLATIINSPLRDAWSFWCVLKCSVSCEIRSVRIAICTSGEPVSDLCARLLEIICCLRSVASAISRVLLLVFSLSRFDTVTEYHTQGGGAGDSPAQAF